jgi:hypothetical protein
VQRIKEKESSLLRTPTAQEAGGGLISPSYAKANNQTLRLGGQIIDLVEPGRLPRVGEDALNVPDVMPDANNFDSWGSHETYVRRWENVVGRKVPNPTEPTGRNGQQQLSVKFTEWLMGLPEGHVSDKQIGLKRIKALKCLGNGVVPQQAEFALRSLLKGVEF